MKITDVKTFILRQKEIEMIGDGSQDTIVVKVETDEGIYGLGEIDSAPYVMQTIINTPASHMACMGLKEVLIGEDPLDVERLWRKMYDKSIYYGRRSAVIHAISGIDLALWDIIGKKLNIPTAKALGGVYRTKVEPYCSVLMPNTEKEIYELIEEHMSNDSYKGIKLGWGALGESFEKDIQLVKWARKALGDDKKLMIDIAMRWTDVKSAINTVKAFEDEGVYWVEEPFHPDNVSAFKKLKNTTSIKITAGEEIGTMHEFRELLNNDCVDIVQPDLSRCGGLTIARKLIDLAEANNVQIIPHAFKTNILMSATLQYIATLPSVEGLEFCEQDTILRKTLTSPIFKMNDDGLIDIPMRKGFGIELNDQAIERFSVK